jgi:hypothetical protein
MCGVPSTLGSLAVQKEIPLVQISPLDGLGGYRAPEDFLADLREQTA